MKGLSGSSEPSGFVPSDDDDAALRHGRTARRDPGGLRRVWYRFLQFWSQWVFLFLFGIRVYGHRNVPKEGPVILASTHQSFLDPVVVGLGLSRPIQSMARDSLFRNRLFRLLITSLNAFPVKRNAADYAAMHESLDRLREGKQLLLFPEGTRTRDGSIAPLHPGLALLAHRTNAAVVPVTIEGAFECWPRGARTSHPFNKRCST